MHVDISRYEKSKPLAIDWFESNGKEVTRTIAYFASISMIPAIVIAFWIAEHLNWREDAVNSIRRLQDFYGYTSIEGKPPGSPL